jgi:hypothetical protein
VVPAIHHVVNRAGVLNAQLPSHRPWVEMGSSQA